MAEPSPSALILAKAILEGFSAPYFAINPEKIETRRRIIREAARNIEPMIREIEDAARRAVDLNAS